MAAYRFDGLFGTGDGGGLVSGVFQEEDQRRADQRVVIDYQDIRISHLRTIFSNSASKLQLFMKSNNVRLRIL